MRHCVQHSRNIARKKLPRVFTPNVNINETKEGPVSIDTKYSYHRYWVSLKSIDLTINISCFDSFRYCSRDH